MKVLFNLGHPAHVHLFKNIIWNLETMDHEVKILTRNKDIIKYLLDAYAFKYDIISTEGKGLLGLGKELLIQDFQLFKIAKNYMPDIMLGVLDPPIAHVGKVLSIPSINITDTEHAKLANMLTLPYSSAILTPSCYHNKIGPKQVCYNGYHELAYLHPNYFTPDLAVLTELGLAKGDPFIIVRFVSWQASHDVGQHGIRDKVGLVKALEQYGRVLITSEGALPPELQPYQIRVSAEKLHDLLYYAALHVGEGGTTASEAAVLGTPSIYVSSLVGTMGNFIELEETYDLLYSFTDDNTALGKAIEILQNPASKEEWRTKRERLLEDKIDVTAFMVWFIENFPRSFAEMKEHPEVQYSCASVLGGAS